MQDVNIVMETNLCKLNSGFMKNQLINRVSIEYNSKDMHSNYLNSLNNRQVTIPRITTLLQKKVWATPA